MRTIHIDESILDALEQRTGIVPRSRLREVVASLSARYREPEDAAVDALTGPEVPAYLAYRFPATFAATSAVLREFVDRFPGTAIRSVDDVGSGPATASLAALSLLPDLASGGSLRLYDHSAPMMAEARTLLSSTFPRVHVTFRHGPLGSLEPCDLSIAAYALGELNTGERERVLQSMWESSRIACIIIEAGTPAGYAATRGITECLSDLGACIVAPVPFAWNGLTSESDWLHFAVRVSRTSLMRSLKGGNLAYEDEKFSYVIAARRPGIPYAARVVRHPQIRRGHVRLRLAQPDGVVDVIVPRSRRASYAIARRLEWGDALNAEELAELTG